MLKVLETFSSSVNCQDDYTRNGGDAVMLVKEFVTSNCLSQPPVVVLPIDYLPKIKEPLKGMARNLIPDRPRKEPLDFNDLGFLSPK